MNQKGQFSDTEPGGTNTWNRDRDERHDLKKERHFEEDSEENGYGADSEDTDGEEDREEEDLEDSVVEIAALSRNGNARNSLLQKATANTSTPIASTKCTASLHSANPTEGYEVICIDDTFDSDSNAYRYSSPRPVKDKSEAGPNENGQHFGEDGSQGSDDDAHSVISLSSGDDSVIILSSGDEEDEEEGDDGEEGDSDANSVISLSSTESNSIIFVGEQKLKRPRKEFKEKKQAKRPKRSRQEELLYELRELEGRGPKQTRAAAPEPKRPRYDPTKSISFLQPYIAPGESDSMYFAVKNSRHPGVFSDYHVALNHCDRPEDVHCFHTLREAAEFLERRPKFFKTTQRQYLNDNHNLVNEVYSDGSSKLNEDGTQLGGFGVWFGHYHPDNIAGPLEGSVQDALQGELQGLLQAYSVIYNRFDNQLYTIYCDCYELVRKLNEGRPLPRKYNVTTRSIQLYMGLLTDRVKLEHVIGHSGHPGNERADILAKIGRTHRNGRIKCLNGVMEDRYRRTIGEDESYPFVGEKLDHLLGQGPVPRVALRRTPNKARPESVL